MCDEILNVLTQSLNTKLVSYIHRIENQGAIQTGNDGMGKGQLSL
jgi:hypothetical protein